MRFEGQTVIVTGASRGIGKEIAFQFAREGAKVACVATSFANAEPTVAAIVEAGGNAGAFGLDISDSAAVKAVFDQIEADLGVPSVLVNNAGVTRDTLLMRMSDEDWDRVISVNLKGAFLCTRAVVRSMMKARYGRIVNLTSVIGLHGQAGQANYAASKAGLLGLTMSTAKELGSRGVTCNAVAPGFIETDMTHDLPEEFRKKVVDDCPAGRLGTPADIAAAVLFLSSKEASFITGQCLTVDGGLML
jgi:3-oxoacyl-[acyl-carrier protein] reductase